VITLSFRPLQSEPVVLVRGTYFRICADGTLRGPDNFVTASYTDGLWHLGRRRHRMLECCDAVYLRVTGSDGRREHMGPYEGLTVADGAILSSDTYLGAHMRSPSGFPATEIWREIVILSGGG
jgi:hypothetical protein